MSPVRTVLLRIKTDKSAKKNAEGTGICFDFNSPAGCSRKNCRFAHEKSKPKALVAKGKKKTKDSANAVKDTKRFCFKCGDPDLLENTRRICTETPLLDKVKY